MEDNWLHMIFLNEPELIRFSAWADTGIQIPQYDTKAMQSRTLSRPGWIHFGAGNIFRGFIASLQHELLVKKEVDTGIIACESFDSQILEKIYAPHDNLVINVLLGANGTMNPTIIGSIAGTCDVNAPVDFSKLTQWFCADSLQIASFTITEKGYAIRKSDGSLLPSVEKDLQEGPANPGHLMSRLVFLLQKRFEAGAAPLALVSLDNCSHNGEKLQGAILTIAEAWEEKSFNPKGFLSWLKSDQVGFPWSMIDKITPRPAPSVVQMLEDKGIGGMNPIITDKGTHIAPFVNAEVPQYLVIEDTFPNSRPPLEKAGVYFTDRETVDRVEQMKVTTCLNPLHTALAIFGCLLGFESISGEMQDPALVKLVEQVGYKEGLPVVVSPGILDPKAFIDEVVKERFPNPFIPDTPQRIATDTSQKVAIRFGRTIQAYIDDPKRSVADLSAIPLVLAAWLRYLMGVNDELKAFEVSPDPLLQELQPIVQKIKIGQTDLVEIGAALHGIIGNSTIFGVDLVASGLEARIVELFTQMIQGKGAVRTTLEHIVLSDELN
jgi:fructuronate reductase